MTTRNQKNQKQITISQEQISYIKENYKVISNIQICKDLGITTAVFYQNVRLINPPVKYEDVYFKHEKLVTI